jgi:outer membrane protein TolC
MMRRQTQLGLLVCALVIGSAISSVAHAQQPLSTFLDAAGERSLDVRQSQAILSQSRAAIEVSRGRLLPAFIAQGTYTRNELEITFNNPLTMQDIVIQRYDQLTGTLTISVPLVDISAWASYFQTEAMAGAADAQVDLARLSSQVAVVQIWHQLVTARALVDAAQRSQSVAEQQLQNVSARVEVGMAAQLDLARATAEVERSRQVVAEAELQSALAARNLENLSGLAPSDAAIQLDDDAHEEGPIDQFLSHVGESPAVRAASASQSAAEAGRNAAWLALLPTVSGNFTERATNAAGFGPSNQWLLGLTATWTLDYSHGAAVAAQDAALTASAVQAERAQQQVATAIFESWHRVRTARVQLESARSAEQATARAAEDARARFEAGAGTQIEQIQAERDRFGAEVARIQATANLRVARAALRLQSGLPVDSR